MLYIIRFEQDLKNLNTFACIIHFYFYHSYINITICLCKKSANTNKRYLTKINFYNLNQHSVFIIRFKYPYKYSITFVCISINEFYFNK
jgi:hypothetical protein